VLFTFFTAYSVTLFEIKDEAGNPVLVVSSDGLRILNGADTLMVISSSQIKAFIDDSKASSRSFSVTKTSSKGSLSNVLDVTTDGLNVFDQNPSSKALGDTLMTISSKTIKAHIKSGAKGLSRSFCISTASSKGLESRVLEVAIDSTAMRSGTDGNDYSDFSPENIFLGSQAGNSITEGLYNVFVGNSAGYNTLGGFYNQSSDMGSRNIFIGHESGYTNTWGRNNIFLGYKSGYTNQTGSWNVFIGDQSGMMTTGVQNTFVGNEAGKLTTSAFGNTFFGCRAGMNNDTGENNTFIGKNSGYTNNGSYNTYIGCGTGESRPTGNYNTIIGANAGSSVYVETNNNTYLGYGAGNANMGNGNVFLGYSAGSNYLNNSRSDRLYIANSDTETPLIHGWFPNKYLALNADTVKVLSLVSGFGNPVYRNPVTGHLVASSSDIRLKENIKPIEEGLDKVMKMRGVNYTWKSDEKHQKKIGLIAQEVEKVLPELVFTNEADGYKGINYGEITAVLIEALKELKKEADSRNVTIKENQNSIKDQSEKIGQLQQENKKLQKEVNELKELHAEIELIKKQLHQYTEK